jgi:hypothetical protein
MGYTGIRKKWRVDSYPEISRKYHELDLYVVELDVIVPIQAALDKVEYGEYAIRPNLIKLLRNFRDFEELEVINNQMKLEISSDHEFDEIEGLVQSLEIDFTVQKSKV